MGVFDWLFGKRKGPGVRCPECGREWPADTRVCYKCGCTLESAKPSPTTPPPPAPVVSPRTEPVAAQPSFREEVRAVVGFVALDAGRKPPSCEGLIRAGDRAVPAILEALVN